MSESLSHLLRRTADEVPGPLVDVGQLVARAGVRQRRRRFAVAGAVASAVCAVTIGAFAAGGGEPNTPKPAPSPPPAPASTRPLVYAEGSTVHLGDQTFDAGETVVFLGVTDDGAVYATEDGDQPQLWFHDGTTARLIGRVSRWPGNYLYLPLKVETGVAGSLVAWEDGRGTGGHSELSDRWVVYDTSRREVVAELPGGVVHVDDGEVVFSTEAKGPHLFRYVVATGATTTITKAELDAGLAAQTRMFSAVAQDGHVELTESPQFEQVETRLVASVHYSVADSDATGVTLTNGDELRLRLPEGYQLPGSEPEDNRVSYWLDDDHVVLAAGDSGGDIGPVHGDVLVCRLPDGVCRVAQRAVTVAGPRY